MALWLSSQALGFASEIPVTAPYIEHRRTVRVAVPRALLPFSGLDEDGKPSGMLVDLVLASMPGLNVEFELVNEGELPVSNENVVAHLHRTPRLADKYYSRDVLAFKHAAYTKADSGIVLGHVFADLVASNLSVAAWPGATYQNGCAYEHYYGPKGPGAHLHFELESPLERHMKFLRGEADVLLTDVSFFDALSITDPPGPTQKWPITSDGLIEIENESLIRFQFASAELGAFFDTGLRNVCGGGRQDAKYRAIVAKHGLPESRQNAWFQEFCLPLLGGAGDSQCPA